MIPFNIPAITGNEFGVLKAVLENQKTCGDGPFTKKCSEWFEKEYSVPRALLTTSCTHALEMTAILLGIGPGDEVIMPSYTFVSTANAYAIRGATIVFVDVNPLTMNMDTSLVERAITDRTRAIVTVHYAGTSCDMDFLCALARKHGIPLVEDAAQAFDATFRGKQLGTFGDFGCFSFHETKNISCGEGGMLLINNRQYMERAEIIREKGTNRSLFLRGMVDKYTWVDIGSSYLPSEFNAGVLWSQIQDRNMIQSSRMRSWELYARHLSDPARKGNIELMNIPADCGHNAHMYYIKTGDIEERTDLISCLKEQGVGSAFHYVPLHSSPFGVRYGRYIFDKTDWTTLESERLLRLPLWYGMTAEQVETVCNSVKKFYGDRM